MPFNLKPWFLSRSAQGEHPIEPEILSRELDGGQIGAHETAYLAAVPAALCTCTWLSWPHWRLFSSVCTLSRGNPRPNPVKIFFRTSARPSPSLSSKRQMSGVAPTNNPPLAQMRGSGLQDADRWALQTIRDVLV